jgi:His/Glu/Gln/Arg/opine family amino acid ABC transporter permease subunit
MFGEFASVFVWGAATTVWISWLALVLGGLAGAMIAMARTARSRPLNLAALLYTEFFRSIPTLVLMFFTYFGLSFAAGVNLPPFVAATIALALEASALMSEVVRAGLQSVDKGQWEAALATGMRGGQVLRYVVWPQAVRVMLPPAVGVYVSTLKASSVAAVIGYVELTKTGLLIRETTGSSFTVLCAIAAVYFTINYSISLGGAALERKFAYVH